MSEQEIGDEEFRKRHSTINVEGKRNWVYSIKPKGKIYNYRSWLSYFYLILFVSLPFIKLNGNPMFQFNFPEGEFIFFGTLFTPQDFIMFGIGMLIFILFIIIFTLIYGRIFCGWICPQTIFMEMVFRKIEFWIEGNGNKQKLNNAKNWTTEIFLRKALKHSIFLVISFGISNIFLSYIIGINEIYKIINEPVHNHVVGFVAMNFFTLAFYTVYAFLREIVCTVICPYGRLQGVLLDKNSIIVAYNYLRGEPRDKKKNNKEAGDCIDCGMCVHVCPTNIDIRNGTQLECINCTACIDACNMMMTNVGRPTALITFASENSIATGKKFELTYRIKSYTALLGILMVLLAVLIVTRTTFDSTIMRVPGQTLQVNADGTISNLYRIKVTNKSNKTLAYDMIATNPAVKIERIGARIDSLRGRQLAEETFFLKIVPSTVNKRKVDYEILLMSGDKVMEKKSAIFISEF